jgi:CRP/FNR family transcriptional activator FtrB
LLRNAIQHGVALGAVLFEQDEVPNFQLVMMAGAAQLFGRSAEGREVLIEVVRAPDLIIPASVVTGRIF